MDKKDQGWVVSDGKLVDLQVRRLQHVAMTVLHELQDRYEQTKCGCSHQHCKKCEDDAKTFKVIDLALEDLK